MEHPNSKEVYEALRDWRMQHAACIRMTTALENQMHAMCRSIVGFDTSWPEEKRDISKKEGKLIKDYLWQENNPPELDELDERLQASALALDRYATSMGLSKAPLDELRADLEKKMVSLIEDWPICTAWVERVHSFGLPTLAMILAESGDLHMYANPAKLWKRFSLHVYKGMAPSTWADIPEKARARADGVNLGEMTHDEIKDWRQDLWARVNYNPRRQTVALHNLGFPLRNTNGQGYGKYRRVYDERREYTEQNRDWSNDREDRDGIRIMVKECLKDLWKAWRVTMPLPTGYDPETTEYLPDGIPDDDYTIEDGLQPDMSLV